MVRESFNEKLHGIWREWFLGLLSEDEVARFGWGRMVGSPRQFYMDSQDLDRLAFIIEDIHVRGESPYISISWFSGHNVLSGVERLMLDFDVKEGFTLEDVREEVRKVLDVLSSYCEPLPLFTGGKGFHVHVWFPYVVRVDNEELAKEAFLVLAEILGLNSLNLRFLDFQVIHPKRLSRPPFTKHVSGKLVTPLDLDLKPIGPESFSLSSYVSKPLPEDVLREAFVRARARLAAKVSKAFYARLKGVGRGWSYGYLWIEKVMRQGLRDGRKRFILYVLSRYLINVRKLSVEEALEMVKAFVNVSCRNFSKCNKS